MSTPYTCIACRVGFPSSEQQRDHYKTDWHRYNLKRKVAGMPPVTAVAFRERVLAQRKELEKQAEEQTSIHACEICDKSFASGGALQSHLNSKKHKDMIKKAEADKLRAAKASSGAERQTESAKQGNILLQPVEEQRKLQEQIKLRAIAAAQREQEKAALGAAEEASAPQADATQPDAEMTDAEAAAGSDSVEKADSVLKLVDCIFCTRRFESFEQNMDHMTNEHGFFIPDIEYLTDLKGLIHYLQRKVGNYFMCLKCGDQGRAFTCLESTRKHMVDKGHIQVNYDEDGQLELGEFYDFSSTYPDNEKLTDEDRDRDMSIVPRREAAADDLRLEGAELVLPSGTRVGHRDLRHIYRQRYRRTDEREAVAIQRIMSQYKALGYHKMDLPSAQKRRDQFAADKHQRNRRLDLGVKANKLQHHFREQVMQ